VYWLTHPRPRARLPLLFKLLLHEHHQIHAVP